MTESFALLLLESPWWTPKSNPSRASALPFFQGIERLHDYFNIYYSTFYDTPGFDIALSQDLVHTHESRQILYIGAHGSESQIANGRASTILEKVAVHGKKIEGVIVSSCLVGARDSNLWNPLLINKTRWVFAYRHTVQWLDSALIEMALLEAIALADKDYADNQDTLIETFAAALSKFNPLLPLGVEGEPLKECICLMQRAKFKHHPENLSELLVDLAWSSQ